MDRLHIPRCHRPKQTLETSCNLLIFYTVLVLWIKKASQCYKDQRPMDTVVTELCQNLKAKQLSTRIFTSEVTRNAFRRKKRLLQLSYFIKNRLQVSDLISHGVLLWRLQPPVVTHKTTLHFCSHQPVLALNSHKRVSNLFLYQQQ